MQSYRGHYHDPSSVAYPVVTVTFRARGLDIRDPDGLLVAAWEYGDLTPPSPPGPEESVVLGCSVSPSARLTVYGVNVRPPSPEPEPPSSTFDPAGALQTRHRKPRRSFPTRKTAFIGVALVACLLGAGSLSTLTAHVGDRSFAQWLAGWKTPHTLPPLCETTEVRSLLDRMAHRIVASSGLKTVPPIIILDTPQIQSFAAPTGENIFLTRGFVAALRTPEELVGWSAHLYGHVAHGHATDVESEISTSGLIVLRTDCQSVKAETEADTWALAALTRADLPTKGLLSFIDRLPRGMSGAWGSFLCSHPVTTERLTALKLDRSTPRDGPSLLSEKEWESLQAVCGAQSASQNRTGAPEASP